MKVIKTVAELRNVWKESEKPLGLVPTMGLLHAGHMALVGSSRAQNATTVVSIFVNPAQFGSDEDFASYPRDMDADLALLKQAGVDYVFAPDVAEMYIDGFDTFVDVGRISARLEGEFRPFHFRGVATVVCKLLTIVRPDRVYFGQKDGQQCLVVKRLNADLSLGAEVVVVPTVREPDGLALSSRNVNLNNEERQAATVLYESLNLARDLIVRSNRSGDQVRSQMRRLIEQEPLAKIDYVSVVDAQTLEELDVIDGPVLVSLAVHIGKTRLIDNMAIESS